MGVAVLIGLIALFGISPVAHAAQTSDALTAVVRIDNLAAVSPDYLAFAQSRAADVFSRIGVRMTWIDEKTAFREHRTPPFTVVLIKSAEVPAVESIVVDALGFADPSISRAHILYDRVEAVTSRSQRSAASILGDVIAHELGHLMLPLRGHSARGIMRSGVDVHVRPIETFTNPQARQILARLSGIR